MNTNQKKNYQKICKNIESQLKQNKREIKRTEAEDSNEENNKYIQIMKNNKLKASMINKAEEMKVSIPDELLEQCINYFIEDPVQKFAEEIELLDKILMQKDEVTYSIDFRKKEDIKVARLIKKYNIKFENVEMLTIRFDNREIKEMEYINSDSFPSKLEVIWLISLEKFESSLDNDFKSACFNGIKSLQNENCSIALICFNFNNPEYLANSVKLFSKVKYIEFNNCSFCKLMSMKIPKFDEVSTKNIKFLLCGFYPITIIKKVFIDSGFVQTLDNIAFEDIDRFKVDRIFKMMGNYQEKTGKTNYTIEDY